MSRHEPDVARHWARTFFGSPTNEVVVRGRFITFEGIDGSGKTTIARRVTAILRRSGHRVLLTREPTDSWLGKTVKRSYDDDVGPLAETFLFLADRAHHTADIRKWLEDGAIVVADRYQDSTFAYQGARLEGVVPDPFRWLRAVSAPAIVAPDLTILLDIPPALGLRRIASRRRKVRFETKAFLARVVANYNRLARSRRFVRIDGSRSVEDVTREAVTLISRRLGLRLR